MADFTIRVRLHMKRDMGDILAIEAETFGDWNEAEFNQVLRSRNVACYVAVIEQTHKDRQADQVIGFVVIELNQYHAAVLNLTALLPEARKKLIEKANQRAARHKVCLTWE